MQILFITSNRVGDAVLSTGLLDHLIQQHPTGRITIACGPYAQDIFAHMPNRERTLVLHKRRWNTHWLPLWGWAAARRWDLVVDVRGSALAFLVRTKRRAVLRPRPGDDSLPKVEQLARILGLSPAPLPRAWFSPKEAALAASLLPEGRPVIALGPTANWAPKVWPAERFVALAQELALQLLPGAVPAVFAGPGESEASLAAPVLAGLPAAIDLTGRLSLSQAAACLARCALFVGNDSGLMHLAAATRVPTLGLFGPTPIEQYAPSGPHVAAVRGGATMEDLSVRTAFAAAERLSARAGMPRRVAELLD